VKLRNETMCLRKKVFWSGFAARYRAQSITKGGTPMRAYHCPNCYQWHLTRQA
jgi:hypothetical protein